MAHSCNPEELHGMTVVLETSGPKVFVGRFDQQLGEHYLLHDADVFEDGRDGLTRQAYLAKSAAFGIWPKEKDLYVLASEVSSLKRLSEYRQESEAPGR